MKCTNCGQDLDTGAGFCGNCGQAVQTSGAVSVPVTVGAGPATPEPVPAPMAAPTPTPMAAPAPTPVVAPAPAVAPVPAPVASATPQAVPAAAPAPAYATAPVAAKGGGKAIAALVLGILSIPGCFIPFLGLILGITGLVMGTLSVKSSHKGMAITGIVLGGIGILLSILVFTANYLDYMKKHPVSFHEPTSTSATAAASGVRSVDASVLVRAGFTNGLFTEVTW